MVRSPAKKMSRNGLKINPRKEEGQKTLSEAFAAGNLIKEAKTQRQEMLKAQEEILVSSRLNRFFGETQSRYGYLFQISKF